MNITFTLLFSISESCPGLKGWRVEGYPLNMITVVPELHLVVALQSWLVNLRLFHLCKMLGIQNVLSRTLCWRCATNKCQNRSRKHSILTQVVVLEEDQRNMNLFSFLSESNYYHIALLFICFIKWTLMQFIMWILVCKKNISSNIQLYFEKIWG